VMSKTEEVCAMQKADTVLAIIRKRGEEGKPLERVYRNLFNRDLFLMAYGRIAKNKGAMTPGVNDETADGMSLAKIDAIIDLLRHERYGWLPVRRTYIPKRKGKKRPLGLPTWSDKLVQEVIRLILEAYYEPQFSDHSHGFRSKRGCHTALREIYYKWRGTTWFIEGDISQCFDKLDHQILLDTLAEKIHDGRFIALIDELLNAGYIEDWQFNTTPSGTPQGGVVSPILSNIYLDRLDKWVENTLIPMYTRGNERQDNPDYMRLIKRASYLRGQGRYAEAQPLQRQARTLPSRMPDDPHFRRLRFVRYADDFLLSFAGPKAEAEDIKRRIGAFLRDELALELSPTKTLVTHARTEPARFLGYHIHTLQDDQQRSQSGQRINGLISLKVPMEVIWEKSQRYRKHGKPVHRPEWSNDGVYDIIVRYQQEYRGLVEYYRLAHNLYQLDRLKYVMETSLTKTLSQKLRISVRQVYQRFGTVLLTENGPYKGLQYKIEREEQRPLVATWGGISLKRDLGAELNDAPLDLPVNYRTELEQRLLADTCELCGSTDRIEVHHIRALRDLKKPGRKDKPLWMQVMIARHRKTLIVCWACHRDITAGRPVKNKLAD